MPEIPSEVPGIPDSSNPDCADAKRLIYDNAVAGLSRLRSEVSAATGSNSALNLLVRNLLRDAANLLGAEFADRIQQELAGATGPAAYFGAAMTTYITVLATVPNVIMMIPYLLVVNLKKYLRIRIEAVNFIRSIISDIEVILRSIPLDSAPTQHTLREMQRASLHLKKCLQFLGHYKNQVRFSAESLSGYTSPSIFHRGVRELDAAISNLHGGVAPLQVDTLSDEEVDHLIEKHAPDFVGDSLGAQAALIQRQIFRAYIRKYGVTYFLILRLIKKLEIKPGSTTRNLFTGKNLLNSNSFTSFDPENDAQEAATTVSTPEEIVKDYPIFAVILTTPIIETYVKALSKLLENLKLVNGLSPQLQSMLGAMFLPMDLAMKNIKTVKNEIDESTEGVDYLSVAEAGALEFSKPFRIAQLEASKVLLYGMDTDAAGRGGGINVISDTTNLMTALKRIEDYLTSGEYPTGSEHPISNLDNQIFGLIPKLFSTLTDVNHRKDVISHLHRIKQVCRNSTRADQDLLNVLNGFNPENAAWFQEALNTYTLIANNLDIGAASSVIYNPIQIGLAKQVGFGIIDGLILGYALLSSVVTGAIRTGGSAWPGISGVGSAITDGAGSIFECADAGVSKLSKVLEEKMKAPSAEDDEKAATMRYIDEQLKAWKIHQTPNEDWIMGKRF